MPDQFAFIQLERDDGGAVLDISEAGLRFETFAPVYQEGQVHFWFSLNLRDRIEAWGEVVWTNAARRSGGLRFLRLSEEDRAQIRTWTAEFSARDVSDEKFAPQAGADGTRGEIGANKHDAVAAFVAKARPRRSSLLAGEGFGDSPLPSLTYQEAAEQASELVPVQRHLAPKQKQLIFGIFLGICVTATFAMAAFKYSNHRRQTTDTEKLAGESLGIKVGPEVQPPALATPTMPKPAYGDVFPSKQRGTSSGHNLNSPLAAATFSPQLRSSENTSQRQPAKTPSQLWASVQAGNSKAAVELAELYIEGEGVPQNCAQARVLLLVASEKRNAGAIKRLRELDKTGCPGE
ncbi:MAG: PilZ domain-containing protein [Candidatus Acidiferrum sp.]